MCPEISHLEWHPFTLSSNPEESYISVHILCKGDWTGSLLRRTLEYSKLLEYRRSTDMKMDRNALSKKCPTFYLAGPFSSCVGGVFDFETSILVGAGVGVTPFISISRSLAYALFYSCDNDIKCLGIEQGIRHN